LDEWGEKRHQIERGKERKGSAFFSRRMKYWNNKFHDGEKKDPPLFSDGTGKKGKKF